MKQNRVTRLVIADDHKIFRDGLKLLFKREKNYQLVGEASDGEELIDLVRSTQPDLVMTDIVMPKMDGVTAVRTILSQYPDTAIIAMSMFEEESMVVDMLQAGALGYLLKDADKEQIIEAINSAMNHRPYYCDRIMTKVIKLMSDKKFEQQKEAEAVAFKDNELNIIRLICEEKTSKEIANLLFMSPRTVEWYRIRIMEKINVKSTTGIVIYAIRNNLVSAFAIFNGLAFMA
ncbi:response regulator transcription factor [Segetibacter sp. 3557_3]|uniref:response regulator transcription factor n=1 Tax=Segetibacter sp. 3557_3 TaxID=2547429 RepID=UPI0010586F97|nr:response regulator transcription factor [Segetibacter sp. 3557_3]TDH21287.1 response regulator transcription factor [Segetibacter sp. 3557_3]